jgi:hypothetical protein
MRRGGQTGIGDGAIGEGSVGRFGVTGAGVCGCSLRRWAPEQENGGGEWCKDDGEVASERCHKRHRTPIRG